MANASGEEKTVGVVFRSRADYHDSADGKSRDGERCSTRPQKPLMHALGLKPMQRGRRLVSSEDDFRYHVQSTCDL
jgi:hypothetical protein